VGNRWAKAEGDLVTKRAEDKDRNAPDLEPDERQQVQRANQILLRLKKELHERETRFSERDVEEAAQSARWLRETLDRHPDGWEQAYEDALAGSDLAGEEESYLRKGVENAGGFAQFAQSNLQRLEDAAPLEGEPSEGTTAKITHQDLVCGVAAGLVAGGVVMGNSFYFGFGIGMSRKAGDCW
jgi:hypothetical protein